MSIMGRLRPTPLEVERLALREANPAHYEAFEPITRGFAYAILMIAAVGVAAAITSPFRLLGSLLGRSRNG